MFTISDSPERSPINSITTHPDHASSKLLISSQTDSLLLLVIYKRNNKEKQMILDGSLQELQSKPEN